MVPYGRRPYRRSFGRPSFVRNRGYRRRYGRRRDNRGSLLNNRRSFPEVKQSTVLSTSTAQSVASDVPVIIAMTTEITQGLTGGSSRIANVITPKSLVIHAQYTAVSPCTVAWWVVLWKQNDSDNAFTTSKFLGAATSVVTHSNYSDRKDFQILQSGRFSMVNRIAAIAVKEYMMIRVPLKLDMHWTASTAASATMNHIFFVAISDLTAAEAEPTLDFSSRLYYSDA